MLDTSGEELKPCDSSFDGVGCFDKILPFLKYACDLLWDQ